MRAGRRLPIKRVPHYHPHVDAPADFEHRGGFWQRSVVRRDLVDLSETTLWSDGSPLPDAKGRGGTTVVDLGVPVRGVARDYRRGGSLGFLLRCSYLDRNRPVRELRVLAELRGRGVPVVEPLAALARRHLLIFHRLRLITNLLVGARPLPAFLAAEPASRHAAVREAGRVVGLALQAGMLHKDLHPDNLVARVVDGRVEVHLLDLDRAELRPELGRGERDHMLVRMARYLRRHTAELPTPTRRVDFTRFLAGMGLSRSERRECLARLRPLYERQLRRRGLG